jgi:hypothetical protein
MALGGWWPIIFVDAFLVHESWREKTKRRAIMEKKIIMQDTGIPETLVTTRPLAIFGGANGTALGELVVLVVRNHEVVPPVPWIETADPLMTKQSNALTSRTWKARPARHTFARASAKTFYLNFLRHQPTPAPTVAIHLPASQPSTNRPTQFNMSTDPKIQ